MNNILFKIRLIGIWFYRILFSRTNMKVNVFKKIYYAFHGFKESQITLYNLTKENMGEYLSEYDWHKSRNINGKHSYLLNNKVLATDLLKELVNVPKIYFIKEKGTLNAEYDDIYKQLKLSKSLFLKPISKGQGIGVRRLDFKNQIIYMDDKEITYDKLMDYLKSHNNYFISQSVKQGKYSKNLYDKTTNTIRMIVIRDPKTQLFKVNFAVQRIGTLNTIPVDNGSKGGLVAKIDLKTGILSEAKCLYNTDTYDVHPDSKKQIKGIQVPDFDSLQKSIVELSNKFPYFNFIAWDILLTDKSFYIIEANTSSGINIVQIFGGVKNKELGNFYRYYKIIK